MNFNLSSVLTDALFAKREYILVLSHMRSYSSLLSHVLGSHPDVAGYAEMNQSYRGPYDLMKLRCRVYLANDNNLAGRFVLDKILHNFRISDSVISRPDVHVIFLLRNPRDAMASIINMAKNVSPGNGLFAIPENVLAYYSERLKSLENCAAKLEQQGLFIESEKIIQETEPVLESLTDNLELTTRLQASYDKFKHTGKPGYGDPSSNIKEGKIIKQKQEHNEIDIPEELMTPAIEAYDSCREVLLEKCLVV